MIDKTQDQYRLCDSETEKSDCNANEIVASEKLLEFVLNYLSKHLAELSNTQLIWQELLVQAHVRFI